MKNFQAWMDIKKEIKLFLLKLSRANKGPKLVKDAPISIKEWKRNFFFVPAEDFSRGFWWRSPTSVKETSPGKLEERNFQKLTGSGLRINCWDFPEAVLVEGGICRALISSDHPILFSSRFQKPCSFPFPFFIHSF